MANNNIQLRIYEYNKRAFISASELHSHIFPYTKNTYPRWVRQNITHQPQEIPIEGIDYVSFEDAGIKPHSRIKGGKKRKDFLLSILFTMQLCYQAKTIPAKNINNFLRKFEGLIT